MHFCRAALVLISATLLAIALPSVAEEKALSEQEKNALIWSFANELFAPGRFQNNVRKWLSGTYTDVDSVPATLIDNYETALGIRDDFDQDQGVLNEDPLKCQLDFLKMLEAEKVGAPFALQMSDSNGKLPPGVMDGNFRWIGSYDQCVRTTATYTAIQYENITLFHDFNGKYCYGIYYIFGVETPAQHSVCVPDSCTADDLGFLLEPPDGGIPISVACDENKPFSEDGHAIAATVVLSAFGALVLLATLVDYGIRQSRSAVNANQGDTTGNQNGGYIEDANSQPANGGEPHTKLSGQVENGSAGEKRTMQSFDLEQAPQHERKPNKCVQTLLSFSLYATLPRVLSAKTPKGTFTCMNGIRFLSMTWIILGHTWQLGLFIGPIPIFNAENFFSQFIYNGRFQHEAINHMNLGVESFFVLSSSLVTISFMKALRRQNDRVTCRQMSLYYFHRFWRLTPVYMIILMAYTCLNDVFSYGPSNFGSFPEAANCRTSWWKHLIYLNNFLMEDGCMGWTWYLANDFQFYVITPLFVFLLYRWPKVGAPFLALGFAGSVAASGYIKHLVYLGERVDYPDYYVKPWCRFTSYAVGMCLGYIMFKTKCKKKIHWALVLLGWIIAGFFMMVAVYGNHGRTWNVQMYSMYFTLQRILFSVGVCWVIYACCSGYGGIINTILSWKGFVPLAKLCYVGYLIHPIIIYYVYYNSKRMIYVDEMNMIIYFGAFLLYTCAATFVITLVFEVPMLLLEGVFIPRKH